MTLKVQIELFDISVPVSTALPVWPDNPPVAVEKILDLAKGDAATVTRWTLGAHTGTHVDACNHFQAGGPGVDALDLSVLIGPARVVEIEHATMITREELAHHDWHGVERVLFKTQNSRLDPPWYARAFNPDFIYLDPDAAAFLTEQGLRLVGVDYLSVEGYYQVGAPTHCHLLGRGVTILEGLYLNVVRPGEYELLCLPLKLKDSDGAPARVVLRS